MAKADYKLEKDPGVDTIFELTIGGRAANVNKTQATLDDVAISKDGIHIIIDAGGLIDSEYRLTVTVDDGGKTLQTDPAIIKGKINAHGRGRTDKTFALK